jgi:putative heme-binding domain-containing protein
MRQAPVKILIFAFLLVSLGAFIVGAAPFPLADQDILPWSVWVFLAICVNMALWQKLMRVAVFSLAVIWAYALLGNLIPQSSSGPAVVVGDIERSPEAFVAAGKSIFYGSGKCSTCHVIGASATTPRCPDLSDIGIAGGGRREGMSAREYLIEALYQPEAFLVKGYGNIMPPVWKPPIALSPLEIETLVAFLQSRGGEPDVTAIVPPIDIAAAAAAAPEKAPQGDPEAGRLVFVEELQCNKCHRIGAAEVELEVGPDLTEIGALNTLDYMEESILDPNAKIVQGYGSTTLSLANGEQLAGRLVREEGDTLVLQLDVVEEEDEDDWGWGDEEEEEPEEEIAEEAEEDVAEDEGAERLVQRGDLALLPIANMRSISERGFFWISAVVGDGGEKVSGPIKGEDETSLTIGSADTTMTVAKSDLSSVSGRRLLLQSKMPKFDDVITVRQFYDLVSYLASLKGSASESAE